ncbi:hypothetical protein D3C80_15880 [compost metagenome]
MGFSVNGGAGGNSATFNLNNPYVLAGEDNVLRCNTRERGRGYMDSKYDCSSMMLRYVWKSIVLLSRCLSVNVAKTIFMFIFYRAIRFY